MKRTRFAATSTLVAIATASVVAATPPKTGKGESSAGASSPNIAQLWIDPSGSVRDLDAGPGGDRRRPIKDARYEVRERNTAGFSISYKVRDSEGDEWNVKIGPEAQTEVVTSRIVWAAGYHQLPSYFVERWIAVEDGRDALRGGARFRPKDKTVESKGIWPWQQNPFVGSRELNGLLVLMMILNNTDLKDQNNELFELAGGPREGASRWYVAKDLGASLGETGWFDPRRGDIDAFEREPFITGLKGPFVKFGFQGRHKNLLEKITADDVKWTCERMTAITDQQLQDAFHAGGYNDETTRRFVARIRQKVAEGLALR
jgi:hypothetical protein